MEITQRKIRVATFFTLSAAFNFLFWQEKPGINYALYSLLFIGVLAFLEPQKLKRKYVLVSLIGILISLFALVYINSVLSIIMFFSSAVLFITFYYQEELRSIYYVVPASAINFFYSFGTFFESAGRISQKTASGKKAWKWAKLLVIPVVITLVFYLIYFRSNPFVEKFSIKVFDGIWQYFSAFFEHYPPLRFVFIGWGALIACYLIFYKKGEVFQKLEDQQSDDIERKRKKHSFPFALNALMNEYRIAFITLISLNLLLLMVNAVDVWKVWIAFDYKVGVSLSAELHEGIYLLILSLLLSIGILVYFFKGNINFMQKNKHLKILGFIWLVQNIALAITAFLKCLYYINYYSLTYKRIGVLMFLSLTIFGLIMMFFKVEKRKSVYFLLRSNSWFVYLFFVCASLVNWDVMIAEYNLSQSKSGVADYEYLISLSTKTLPVLLENKTFYEYNHKTLPTVIDSTDTDALNYQPIDFEYRIRNYLETQNELTLMSWNKSDQYLVDYFRSKGYKRTEELIQSKLQ